MSFVGDADVGGRRRLHSAAEVSGVVHGTPAGHPAPEHLLVGSPEVLGQERVDDGVDGGVAVGQAVSHHPEDEGGLVQGERAELHPQVDDVVGQPGQTEDHHHHQDCLRRLWRRYWLVVSYFTWSMKVTVTGHFGGKVTGDNDIYNNRSVDEMTKHGFNKEFHSWQDFLCELSLHKVLFFYIFSEVRT